MRLLLGIILAAAALWSGYWFVGAKSVSGGLESWLDARQGEGWVAEYSDLETRGYPNRFDTTINQLQLADTRSGLAWTAPFFQILALSYKPNHIIAVWPNEQVLASPFEKITIASEKMIGSVVFEPGTSLTLDRSNFDLNDFALNSDLGWTASVSEGEFYTRQASDTENAHDIWFQAKSVRPSKQFLARLDPADLFPKQFKTLRLSTQVAFDAPWDRFAIEQRRPQITQFGLKDLTATWGKLDFRATGTLDVDENGVPTGEIMIKAKNWRDMLNIAVNSGIVPLEAAGTIERVLEVLAVMAGHPDTLDAPLTFKDGLVNFGPVTLGAAPNFTLR